jgi:maltooligosyltrehalose trehalohydrolase
MHQAPHEELLRWHQTLISLRRNTPALQDGRLDSIDVEFNEADSWLVLYRQSVALVCNFSGRRLSLHLKFAARTLLASDPDCTAHENAVDIAGESVLIVEKDLGV